MRSKRMVVVLVAGAAGVVAFVAANAIGSSGLVKPIATNSAGEPVIKSPNGQFSITVGNAGIVLKGPNETVVLSGTSLRATVPTLDLRASLNASMQGGQAVGFRAGSSVNLTGTQIQLNGCAQPVVRGTDAVVVNGSSGKIVPGQQAVCMG
ncbi:MAG TPA: hypothetical protein VGM80_00460 [Gaiellaceae bacterium]